MILKRYSFSELLQKENCQEAKGADRKCLGACCADLSHAVMLEAVVVEVALDAWGAAEGVPVIMDLRVGFLGGGAGKHLWPDALCW